MVEGDKWEMYIPSELGYGDRGSPPKIQGGDALIFTMELLTIEGNSVPASKCEFSTMVGCSQQEKDFIVKSRTKFRGDVESIEEEVERIRRVSQNGSKKNKDWANRRAKLLTHYMNEL